MSDERLVDWLLNGDVSIQYQVYKDLFSINRQDLQERIATEGWGAMFLAKRKEDGHWGSKFYQPKWTSTHYTLLDLRNLWISPEISSIRETLQMIPDHEKGEDGGINPSRTIKASDVCINGMFLNYATYFKASKEKLNSIVDFILSQHMPDGGFNCRSNRSGAVHSSLHTTLSVLEGITEYQRNRYTYKVDELKRAKETGLEFILKHKLFLSDRTGEIIHKDFLELTYPCRWKYDILRALDYFRNSGTEWDERMGAAIRVLINKRNKDGTWNQQAKHPGEVHFEMEPAGKPGRWNTLRALRVLNHYQIRM